MNKTANQTLAGNGENRFEANAAHQTKVPDAEVVARQKRRNHTVAYKLKVLETVAALRGEGNGAIGAYLRKEGLYYSNVRSWISLQEKGQLTASSRGPKEKNRDSLLAENKTLRRQLEQVEKRLARTEMIVDIQKKLSAILHLEQEPSNEKSAEE